MKIECQIEKIKNALLVAERMTGKNLTLPVLGSILFVAHDKKLKLRATNLNIGIEIDVPARVDKDGIVAIKGDVLSSLFSSFNGDSIVVFELINGNLSIKTKQNTILLKSIAHDDFPTIPNIEGDEVFISSKKLVEGLKSVYYSASNSEIKPEIGSVYIYPNEDMLVFVATDSFRLAEKRVKIKQKLSFDGVLIPLKNVIEMIKVFDGFDDDLKIVIQKNQISLSLNGIYLTSRVIDGNFPDYKQIIPKNSSTNAVVLKQDFISSLRISNIFSDKFNQITIKITPSEKIFEIESRNSDVGENNTIISGSFKGDDVSANFNYKYILDCFGSISNDSISLDLDGNNKPMIIRGVSDSSFMYLIMPMNR